MASTLLYLLPLLGFCLADSSSYTLRQDDLQDLHEVCFNFQLENTELTASCVNFD